MRLMPVQAFKGEYADSIKCRVSTGYDGDSFVGVRVENGIPEVCFPLGFSIPDGIEERRKDVIMLLRLLRRLCRKEGLINSININHSKKTDFPISAFQRMVLRFLNNGEYHEYEDAFLHSKEGKINWSRTIKMCKPQYSSSGAIYLDYYVRKSKVLDDSLIEKIYDYCVYISFSVIGWLYFRVQKPDIRFNKRVFSAAVRDKLAVTFNDRNKELFSDMLAIINCLSDTGNEASTVVCGTNEFEYVWEKVVDNTFGVLEKELFFPHSFWMIAGKKEVKINNPLEPDTIMIKGNKLCIVDAKYYKYGVTGNVLHLPNTSSIHKQITYGEYIDSEQSGFKGKYDEIYNVFLLPGDLRNGLFKCNDQYKLIGYAGSDWKDGTKTYEWFAVIIVDTKYLLQSYLKKTEMVEGLSDYIEGAWNTQKQES